MAWPSISQNSFENLLQRSLETRDSAAKKKSAVESTKELFLPSALGFVVFGAEKDQAKSWQIIKS